MKDHITFKVGGPADCWLSPKGEGFTLFCKNILNTCEAEEIPVFILGGGANIVVSDKGIRGIALDMSGWKGELYSKKSELIFRSGTSVDKAVDTACAESLCGLEFLAGMPGTIGGAVYMNARCYDSEIADVLNWVEIIGRAQKTKGEYVIKRVERETADFAYKQSPFQKMDCVILRASFKIKTGDKEKILNDIYKYREDREKKGHYRFPCAGSVFKNNRDFGKPAGQIIDELGLKGYKKGGAQIAPFHGNIIINTDNACAADIRALVDEVALKVKEQTGFILEPEILFVGEW
ncbi:MAG: UDP-N-acetylmuramate dehydrogenase [Spirochaetes bacterium]|nr:UDP-N-acetylmuramate dehydrogenase [Spirochaetota bacterium]